MKISEFQALLKPVTELISGMAIDSKLAEELNRRFPPGGETFEVKHLIRLRKRATKRSRMDGCVQTAMWGDVGVVLLNPVKRQKD
jgi:hypothetical protein